MTSIARPGRYSGVHPIHAFLSNQSQATILFLVCAISVGLCLIDRETDRELAFSIFYLVPIGIAAWYGGIPQAVFVSVFSVSLWFIVDASVQHPYAHPLVPYWNATVRLSLFVVVGYLLTTLRRMFEQLREGESRYRQFASASSEGVFVHDEGIIVDASEHFASMLGYDISELIGRNGFELAAPVYRDLVRKHSRMGSEVSYSVVLCRKDGSAMPVEVTARPVAHGRKALRLVTIRDLSEWKRAEAIIRKSEARYRTVFEQSMKPIVVTTFDGSILDGNPAALRLFGTSTLDGFTQKRMVDYLTTQPDVWSEFRSAIDVRGYVEEVEWTLILPSAKRTYVRVAANVQKDAAGSPESYQCFFREITTERELAQAREHEQVLRLLYEARTRSQEEERRRISREIHDNLGQLITAAKLQVEILKDALLPDSNQRMSIEAVDRLLKSAIQESKSMSYKLRPSILDDFGLMPALQSLCEQFAAGNGVKVRFEGNAVHGRLDPTHETELYRIAQESLANVVRHANATEAKVALAELEGSLLMTVADNGRGFSVNDWVDNRTAPRGIGLMNMQERAASIGGTLRIASTPDSGTIVSVELPLTKSAD